MTSSQKSETILNKEFQNLEKEALKEISLEVIKSDLLQSLDQLHQKERKELEKSNTAIAVRCVKEIQEGIKKQLREQIEEHFQKVVQSCQSDISVLVAPLLRQTELDLNSLNSKVSQTNKLCDEIQKKYAFRWEKPFLITLFSCILTGAFICIILILLQFSPLSVFLMNKETREIYNMGLRWKEIKREMASYKPKDSEKTQNDDRYSAKMKKK